MTKVGERLLAAAREARLPSKGWRTRRHEYLNGRPYWTVVAPGRFAILGKDNKPVTFIDITLAQAEADKLNTERR